MRKRIVTKIGDIFCVEFDGKFKCYFQYIANDLSQLNSSVIRAFKRRYPIDYKPLFDEVVKDEVLFYAHTVLRAGIQFEAWYKVGKSTELGADEISKVIFGYTLDTKSNLDPNSNWDPLNGIEMVDPLTNWFIWHINGPFTNIGKLPDKYRDIVEVGAIMSYTRIVQRIKYGYYPGCFTEYEVLKRIPRADVDSFTRIEEDKGRATLFHFYGDKVVRQIEAVSYTHLTLPTTYGV